MRVTRQEMDSGHREIVDGAARLLRERGLAGTSVADAMGAAGKTHGGFYRHFASKDDLVVEALRVAFDQFVAPLQARREAGTPREAADEYRRMYLSDAHVASPGRGCPMPALGGELARASETVNAEFAAGLRRLAGQLAPAHRGSDADRQAAALREIAMLVGAVLLARASDEPTAKDILAACRR